ncbi:MAG: tRNA (adenosine(37)-N6)-threonylcarbamoyltransferase complex transferase subunit TsaD [Candidatus Aenigmarchaeota archaeon CG_4_10_14_0_8_um_filter_37_24]|nr:tRNA (adenosine(37)-N6)-threonylcarbamoyltransferase complex transferase subunit TsaD [Candidatus Aenigmarchaeota archaeon]OIN85935.1 MAG: tRNA (adenosine(37)-N6)-threonylcarbamoyltransferase complex transferase subunit TsaD [Candidatus Aenigmarchaeota archaeon CG1_02_38_14]PIW40964.1 MAG: tRNA (adenosine(37)-N6)-threonylcarbamoyltransferase complex transferase subunit TsaD [Candidatus Aenigmarchaeota archaeon CG15_BIG_FIL_POST_REV_8_21_14_020_37_27]PIX50419.1 MAG: tRNA (adenosine(37)-N6)-thr
MKILAIDTSCDETSASVCSKDRVLSNVIFSQVELHSKWRGVVPIIAKRAHQERINPVIEMALKRAKVKLEGINVFAVTAGPGLAIALEVGIKKAVELSVKYKKPLVLVDHMEGHIYANFGKNGKGNYFNNLKKVKFPLLCLLVSGGHTEIVLMKDHGKYELIGQTLDDAVGEAFDKIARPLMLGYPGGPIIEEFAKKGRPERFQLPIPMQRRNDFNFSYSGLKTACVVSIEKLKKEFGKEFPSVIPDFCASFQKTISDSLIFKLKKAAKKYKTKQLLLGGGVVSNNYIRSQMRKEMRKLGVEVIAPNKRLCTDNAAMIGLCAYYRAKKNRFVKNLEKVDRLPNLQISQKIPF